MKIFTVKSPMFVWDVENEQVVDYDNMLVYEQFLSKVNDIGERVLKNYNVETYRLNNEFTIEKFYENNKNNIVIFYMLKNSIFHIDEIGNSIRVVIIPTKESIENEQSFEAILIPLNVKNLNGRIYKDNENLRENIDNFNKRVKDIGVVYGEYNYPESFDINLSRVTHTIKNVRIEGENVIGDIKILNNDTSIYVKRLKEHYKEMVFRPRSTGIINDDGSIFIKKLFTFDAINQESDSFFNIENN